MAFLRNQPPSQSQSAWPHHLTLARLVARALRLPRSAVIQTAAMPQTYSLGYITALLLWPHDVVVVLPEAQQERFLADVQSLQGHLKTAKRVQRIGDCPQPFQDRPNLSPQNHNGWIDQRTLLLTTPQIWLSDRFNHHHSTQRQWTSQFPLGCPTVIDGGDDLETWARDALTLTLAPQDWQELVQALPDAAESISQTVKQLNQDLCDRPRNPYGCYALEPEQQAAIERLSQLIGQDVSQQDVNPPTNLSQNLLGLHQESKTSQGREAQPLQQENDSGLWGGLAMTPSLLPQGWRFLQRWQQPGRQLRWATIEPTAQGEKDIPAEVRLHVAPMELAPELAPLWQQQPTVFLGRFLGLERQEGQFWRDRLGLGDLTTVKFAPQRQQDLIQLYVPERLAFPNDPAFRDQLLNQILRLCRGGMLGQRHGRQRPPEWISPLKRPVVLVVEDTPLRAQVSTVLAAEFGSCVQLETPNLNPESILVTGWDFWQQQQDHLPPPQLLIIATLPLPSMENPLVAAQVQHLKRQRQDWFQGYLLPIALQRLQRAVLPVRDRQGVVALLDNRVNHRSYGRAIFTALEPYARINYIDFVA
ncbi:MAG: helicase C-terminal domain-containing protein [Spirulinaceae cyanobacterium]